MTPKSLLMEWKLTAKAELNCKNYKYCRKYWKTQVSFCHQSSPVSQKAWKLPRKLQELKSYARKTFGCGQPGGHLIRVLNERCVSDSGNLSPLWLVILKSVCNSVGDTFYLRFSWPWAVASYILLATVPWNWDWKIRIGEQGYVFIILTDLKKSCFHVSFLTSISVSSVILKLRNDEFFK